MVSEPGSTPPHESLFDVLATAVREGSPAALVTVVGGADVGAKLLVRPGRGVLGSLGQVDLDRAAARDAAGELEAGRSRVRRYGPCGETGPEDVVVFVESFAPPPDFLVLGAVDFTAALVRVATVLGYRVTVCDARAVFATAARFPGAAEVVVDQPYRLVNRWADRLGPRDAVCVLTHDAKFDVPVVIAALQTRAGYIGVMGSRRTHDDRTGRLLAAGVTSEGLARLRSPIGLDLGARTPEETAVSICAEIIALRGGRELVRPLRETAGAIHAVG